MKIRHFLFFSLFCLGAIQHGMAQNFEWLRTFGGANSSDWIYSVNGEPSGGCAFLTTVFSLGSGSNDSIFFENYRYSADSSGTYLVRVDSLGKVIKARAIGNFIAGSMCRDKAGDFYVSGVLQGINAVASVSMDANDGSMVFVKFDKNLNFIWATQTGNTANTTPSRLYCMGNHIYFTASSMGSTKIKSNVYNFGSLYSAYFYGELDAANGDIKWSNYFYDGQSGASLEISDIVNLKGKLYFSGYILAGSPDAIIGGNTVKASGSFVAQADTLGNYEKIFLLYNGSTARILCMATDGHHLYIGGCYSDTIKWGGNKIAPEYPAGSYKLEMFAASLTPSLTPRWFYRPKIIDKLNGGVNNYFARVVSNNGFMYFGGVIDTKVLVDISVLQPSNPNMYDIMLMKTDSLSNVLWATNGLTSYGSLYAMDGSAGNSVFAAGGFSDSIKLGVHRSVSRGSYDAFVTKITDYSITRGDISKGPYCAGDTLLVPYTKIGNYDKSNYFIAELSNEYGNFDGGHRELGRLKTTEADTIIGTLPLFQVASSPLYRIRIRSTAPAVQSYFKLDNLKLLIYSKDKANPGKNELLCRGDTMLLTTFGGTRWKWSPAYNMHDSTARTTAIWPNVTTTYRIVIADSSGCGAPDTAFKTIIIRKDPKVSLSNTDTIVCMADSVKVRASFSLGDTSGYAWSWLNVSPGKNALLLAGKGKLSDMLAFKMPANEKDSQVIAIVFGDGCSPQKSIAYYRIYINKNKAVAKMLTADTSICPGTSINAMAGFSKGRVQGYKWEWITRETSGLWKTISSHSGNISDTLSYIFPTSQPKKRQLAVTLTDGCSPFTDTAILNITPRDALDIMLNTKDTLLCKGIEHVWRATGKGGYTHGYSWQWTDTLDNNILSDKDSLLLKADKDITIRVKLTDNCMPDSSVKTFTLHVNPPLEAAITAQGGSVMKDTTICYGQNLRLFSKGKGGDFNNYSFSWLVDNNLASSNDTLLVTGSAFPKTGSIVNIMMVLKDNCTKANDTATATIKILPVLDIIANASDSICYRSSALYKTKATGGTGTYTFNWYDEAFNFQGIGDSLKVLHNAAAGNTKRFVTVSDGCTIPGDTASATSVFLQPLSITLNTKDTLLCKGIEHVWRATGKGGYTHGYSWQWTDTLDNNILSDKDSLLLKADKDITIRVKLTDNCMPDSSIKTFTLHVNPPLEAAITAQGGSVMKDTTICYRQNLRLFSKGKGGDFNNYSFSWLVDNNLASSNDTLLVTGSAFPKTGSIVNITLVLEDNCTKALDTATATIKILPALDIIANASDSICYRSSALYKTKATGGTGTYTFNWYDEAFNFQGIGDSLKVLHNAAAGNTKRFVTVSDGCTIPGDTASATSVFLQPLSISLQAQDTCLTLSGLLTANVSGGKGYNYKITWWDQYRLLAKDTAPTAIIINAPLSLSIFKAVLNDGCSIASDTIFKAIGAKPQGALNANPVEGCEILDVTYTLSTTYIGSYSWNLITGYNQDSIANLAVSNALVKYPAGVYTAQARINTLFGCSNLVDGPVITVFPRPVADFNFTPSEPTIDNPDVQFNNISTSAVSYTWDLSPFGTSVEESPKVSYKDTGRFKVKLLAFSDKGCRDSIEKEIYVLPNYHIWIPSTFTPNNDGVNDVFSIHNSGTTFTGFSIYNRWGEMIYDTDKNIPWDGTFQGLEAPEGIYMYLIKVRSYTWQQEYLHGTLTLLR